MNGKNPQNVEVESIKLSDISDNLLRFDFYSQRHIEELSASIKSKGLLEAMLVHRSTNCGKMVLLNGHYRIRALKRLGIKESVCRILEGTEEDATTNYLAAFLTKSTTTALEEGHIILELVKKGYGLERIGTLWGKSASWACRRLKLIKALESEIKEQIKMGSLAPRVAQELTRLPQGKEQKRVYEIVVKNNLTKDETAGLVAQWLKSDEKGKGHIEQQYAELSPKKQPTRYHFMPQNALKTSLVQCCKTLSVLMNCMEHIKDYRQLWPWSEYEDFCKGIRQVAILLEPSAREGDLK